MVEDMISEAPGSINFTMFLTLMGEKLSGTDPEAEILQAFECFDDAKTGVVNADILREAMTTMGDRFTDDEVRFSSAQMKFLTFFLKQVDIMYKGGLLGHKNDFKYKEFVKILKHGE
jgi:hypothetical protein